MSKLKITIAGRTGSGKSTVAKYLASVLRRSGVDVTIVDDTPTPTPALDQHELTERINNMCKYATLEITVVTKQVMHPPMLPAPEADR